MLELERPAHFALRSLDRILAEAWQPGTGPATRDRLLRPGRRATRGPGLLDDYAFTAVACLDAYEATADLSYFNFAQRIADKMIERFFDPVSGGFFDTRPPTETEKRLESSGRARKPFQDSPTPAGNSVAAIALLGCTVTPTSKAIASKRSRRWNCWLAGREVWDLRRDLWDRRRALLPAAYPDRDRW